MDTLMEKLKPFVDSMLYDTIIPIMCITQKDRETFTNEPVDYIRNQYDFDDTIFNPRNEVQDLLCHLTVKPEDQKAFLQSSVKFFEEYNRKLNSDAPLDWRVKEALMYAIAIIRERTEIDQSLEP